MAKLISDYYRSHCNIMSLSCFQLPVVVIETYGMESMEFLDTDITQPYRTVLGYADQDA